VKKPHFHFYQQTIKNILKQAGMYERVYEKIDQMENFGQLIQMDTSFFSGLCGYKRVYLILNLEDMFCIKDIKKVDRTNAFSYNGALYRLNDKKILWP